MKNNPASPGFHLKAPVVFIIYKRLELTERVFQTIRQARPRKLFVIADGPRDETEAEQCKLARKIIEQVDWECDVRKNYSDVNLGLRKRMISGLDEVFHEEERAIILEDDCLPHQTFFHYCDELLEFYKNDAQVMHISGDNFLQSKLEFAGSYYFSKYAHVWGCATWRRAWQLFHQWDTPTLDYKIFKTQSERIFWAKLADQLRNGTIDHSWAYQWVLACMGHKALAIMPKNNLVSNLGFGQDATNIKFEYWWSNLPSTPMTFPLVHPSRRRWDAKADQISATTFFGAVPNSPLNDIKRLIRELFQESKNN